MGKRLIHSSPRTGQRWSSHAGCAGQFDGKVLEKTDQQQATGRQWDSLYERGTPGTWSALDRSACYLSREWQFTLPNRFLLHLPKPVLRLRPRRRNAVQIARPWHDYDSRRGTSC